jgi:hypothetical protein
MRNVVSTALQLLVILSLLGCSTRSAAIITPAGPVHGTLAGPLTILGIATENTETGNQTSAPTVWTESVTIDVPVGTQAIVPAITGLNLSYGAKNARSTPSSFVWDTADHHLGFQHASVIVTRINPPDPSGAHQTAEIQVQLFLRDVNGDDPWFGGVGYQLIFLGR